MVRMAVIALALAACKAGSESPGEGSAPAKEKAPSPEPPGGPPSCAEVGGHLAAALHVPASMTTNTNGVSLSVSGSQMHGAMQEGLAEACRDLAWTQETRACVMGWNGNILRERAKLAALCPGIDKK